MHDTSYHLATIDAGHNGHFGVESELGRSIVLSRGDMVTMPDGTSQYQPRSRFMLDARDIPRLIEALETAATNTMRPLIPTLPNSTDAPSVTYSSSGGQPRGTR